MMMRKLKDEGGEDEKQARENRQKKQLLKLELKFMGSKANVLYMFSWIRNT